MTSAPDLRGLVATLVDAPVRGELRTRAGALLTYDEAGTITQVLTPEATGYDEARAALGERLEVMPSGTYVLPGLVDLHNHAPQWPQLGKALDVPLEVWLNEYTFPLEARYSDVGFASRVYSSLVNAMIANGTTTAVYFGTVHQEATRALVDRCLEAGHRALIGKVAMDHPDSCPDYYRDRSAAAAVDETLQFIEYVRSHPGNGKGLVTPAITPRFIPSCTDELLAGLGEVAAETASPVQTHCSESDWAHGYGLERFGRTDTATYEAFGLLRQGTILAHSNFVDEADMASIAAAGACVAHCPLSNVYFANAVFPVRQALERGVNVGLGTDISGGPSPSILAAASSAVAASRVLEDGVDATVAGAERGTSDSRITFAEAFWLATTGGGIALGLPIGLIEPGYRFDAIAVDCSLDDSDLVIWPEMDSALDVLQKILNGAGRREIARVWIDGEVVKPVPRLQ
jgi:guanine deaminase